MSEHHLPLSNPTLPVLNLVMILASSFLARANANLEIICHITAILTFIFYSIMNAEKIYYRAKRLLYKKHRKTPIVEEKEETEDAPE